MAAFGWPAKRSTVGWNVRQCRQLFVSGAFLFWTFAATGTRIGSIQDLSQTFETHMSPELKPFSWQRMIEAVEADRERVLRATAALREANIPYAVAGGNAVAAWVARVDRAAVRNTQDVDILVGVLTSIPSNRRWKPLASFTTN